MTQAVVNDGNEGDEDDEVDDAINDDIEDDEVFNDNDLAAADGGGGNDVNDSILDGSSRQILHGQIDPIEWKIELERVGQKLKAQQVISTNEWRAHVDQTITSKDSIDRILAGTKGDLTALNQ